MDKKKKILFSWVGHADLLGMARTLHDDTVTSAVLKLVQTHKDVAEEGPVKDTVSGNHFDSIVLLWNYPDRNLQETFRHYIDSTAKILPVDLQNPTDYGAIYLVVERILKQELPDKADAYYLLSPGTPAMAAIWVLLGKTQYPGRFLQVYRGQVSECAIPFDLTLEVLPQLMQKTGQVIADLPFSPGNVPPGFEDIIGQSPVMRDVVARAAKAAQYDVPVLLTGESGTGKEMFANAIWKASCRANGPFEAINCAALPANLLEAELFGYRKGAFTGAVRDKAGAFKRLDGGTLFLDEVGECTPELQAKLLRVLQPPPGGTMTCREFYPVGSEQPDRSDVRIIAATNRDLREMIGKESFRSDLFFRLAAITVHLPPLRERKEDILPLAEALLKRANQELKRANAAYKDKIFCKNTKLFIQKQQWNGNVRELFNAILQGVVMSEGREIGIEDLGCEEERALPQIDLRIPYDDATKELQKQYVTEALKRTSGNKTRAAKLLGMANYQRLDAILKKLDLENFSE